MSEASFKPAEDLQELEEPKSFSGLALLAFLGSCVSSFSILYVHFVPIAIASIVGGAIVLSIAKRAQLSSFSQFLGAAAISIAATTASWGYFSRAMILDYDLKAARSTAELYLENLSAGNQEKLLMLVGVPLETGDMSPDGKQQSSESPLAMASRKLNTDSAHVEIRGRKSPAKWVYAGLEAEYPGEDEYTYKLRYVDEGQTNPPAYWVFARKNCPKAGPTAALRNKNVKPEDQKLDVHWFIQDIQLVQKQ
ncbi:MAG: hypothetical protein ACK5OC_27445 [Pirellula sp.]|jgi:hypothetical protein